MNWGLKRLAVTAAAISAIATAAFYVDDTRRAREFDAEQAGQVLRQLSSQVEALMLSARERGEEDPIGYAVRFFAQGAEPRAIRVNKLRERELASLESESESADAALGRNKDGWYELRRVLDRDAGAGVRIRLQPTVAGFLGARSALSSDLRAAALFTLVFLLIALAAKTRADMRRLREAARLKADARQWSESARDLLARLGSAIRATLEASQELGEASESSRHAIEDLHASIHRGLTGVHHGRRALCEQEVVSAQAQLSSLKLEKALREGQTAQAIEHARALQAQMESHRRLARVSIGAMGALELELEPWSQRIDDASHGLGAAVDAGERLREQVRETTDGLKGQAQFLRDIADATK